MPKYGDIYREEDGSLWMLIAPDGSGASRMMPQWYYLIPLTDSSDEEMKALEDTASGWRLGTLVDEA
jgi:hypothetical protein